MPPEASRPPPAADVLERIKEVVGTKGWSDDPDVIAPYVTDFRDQYRGRCALFVRPASTAEVAKVVAICAEAGVPIVPQGGNTSQCGGATPHEEGTEILLNLSRMNRVRAIDPLNYTITVEAGCILADIQRAAADADRLFPLSLGAEGSCQIGGNLSTNAGGVNVLRYGNARDLVLGLEVVLPDGRVWDGLRGLRKDNTGYDLKQLFVGAEGTLGIITAAVLKLFPRPREVRTCFAALEDLDGVIELLARARATSGDAVTSFELIPRIVLDFGMRHDPNVVDPLEKPYEYYVLAEFSGARADGSMATAMEEMLEEAFSDGLVLDAVIAQSESQRADLWRIREAIVEAQKREGASIKHDISVPVSSVPTFLRRAGAAVTAALPGVRPVAFGHVGDGNLHYNLSQPPEMDPQDFLARRETLNAVVYGIVEELGGSVSAEHGIGRLKRAEFARHKTPLELELMCRLKAALDPAGIMNPGKVLPS